MGWRQTQPHRETQPNMIDVNLLQALGVSPTLAAMYAPILDEACPLWGIDERREVAGFLANCTHESDRFAQLSENLNYSAQGLANTWARFSVTGKRGGAPTAEAIGIARQPFLIANTAYANRMGNGDENSGDGWRFRGRGLIQVTGRSNYEALAEAWGVDCVERPELLATPEGAVVSACWFWKSNGCNELAQSGRWEELRRKVNGGTLGMKEVGDLLETALKHLGEQ